MEITDVIRIARAAELALNDLARAPALAAEAGKLAAVAGAVRVFGDKLSLDSGGFDGAEAGAVSAALAVDPARASREELVRAIESLGGKPLRAAASAAPEEKLRAKLKKMQVEAKKPEPVRFVKVNEERPSGELAQGFRPPGVDTSPQASKLAENLLLFFKDAQDHPNVVSHFHAMGCDRRCVRPGGACPDIRVCTGAFDPSFDPDMPDALSGQTEE